MKNALDIFQKITKELLEDEKKHPVAEYIPTSDLFSRLDLELTDNPISDEAFERILRDLIFASPRTATTGFFNQLFGGRNSKAILGELLSVILNNSMYTYKAAGPQIGVEKNILRTVCNMIGWDENSDGTLAPGGSMTNFMSMVMARDAASAAVRLFIQRITLQYSKECCILRDRA
jgi:glutamate/tyrosine decarboxylase-like PLP-dependent enzyme